MSQTYERASDTIQAMVANARSKWHRVLIQCDVTIDTLMVAEVDEETGETYQTLKCHGYPAAATMAITPLKQRALGIADAVLVLDEATWHKLGQAERRALLDHELHHLQVRAEGRGFVGLDGNGKLDCSARLDDQRRPVLKLRKHDWQLGGFQAVARRHKSAAIEVQAARHHQEPGGQYCWDFGTVARIDTSPVRSEAEILDDLGRTSVPRRDRQMVEEATT